MDDISSFLVEVSACAVEVSICLVEDFPGSVDDFSIFVVGLASVFSSVVTFDPSVVVLASSLVDPGSLGELSSAFVDVLAVSMEVFSSLIVVLPSSVLPPSLVDCSSTAEDVIVFSVVGCCSSTEVFSSLEVGLVDASSFFVEVISFSFAVEVFSSCVVILGAVVVRQLAGISLLL